MLRWYERGTRGPSQGWSRYLWYVIQAYGTFYVANRGRIVTSLCAPVHDLLNPSRATKECNQRESRKAVGEPQMSNNGFYSNPRPA